MISHDLKTNTGFSLIEVMVAVVVLSIGLMGLAGLQTIGMRFNHESYGRTQATFQAYDIIDRMRVNRTGTNGNAHANYDNVSLGATGTSHDCVANPCTSTELSEDDIFTWKVATARLLPEGQGAICRGTFNSTFTSCTLSSDGNVYDVVIRWKEQDLPVTFQTQSQL